MPRVKAYRKKDGTLVRAHTRKSVASLRKMTHLRRVDPRFGRSRLDSRSIANIARYGKPGAFGHKPSRVPLKPGMDLKHAKEHRQRAEELLGILRSLPAGLSRSHYLSEFKHVQKTKRKTRGKGVQAVPYRTYYRKGGKR